MPTTTGSGPSPQVPTPHDDVIDDSRRRSDKDATDTYRYLEHSRIYRFANGSGPGVPSIHLGSADLMPRNLDRRVEALVTIVNPILLERIDDVLAAQLADDQLAWRLVDSTWRKVPTIAGRECQTEFHDLARTWASQARNP